jgi:hypothetical protein
MGSPSAGVGGHLPLLDLALHSAGPVGAAGAVGLSALAALLAVDVAAVAAVGAAGDRPGAGGGLGGVAFCLCAVHHHPGAEDRVVLGAADPLGQLPTRPRPDRSSPWLSATNTGSRSGVTGRPLRWRTALGVARRHPKAVAGERLPQRRPGSPKLLRCGVDAAQPFGQGEGAFGLVAVGQEPAGLPAHPTVTRAWVVRQHWLSSWTRPAP